MKGDEEDAHGGSGDTLVLVCAHPCIGGPGFPQGHALQPGADMVCVRSSSPAALDTVPTNYHMPMDDPGSITAFAPLAFFLKALAVQASTPSHAKLPLPLVVIEATSGPHHHLPCAPWPCQLAAPVPSNRHQGLERVMLSQELHSRVP